jgi:hypothetical protein
MYRKNIFNGFISYQIQENKEERKQKIDQCDRDHGVEPVRPDRRRHGEGAPAVGDGRSCLGRGCSQGRGKTPGRRGRLLWRGRAVEEDATEGWTGRPGPMRELAITQEGGGGQPTLKVDRGCPGLVASQAKANHEQLF